MLNLFNPFAIFIFFPFNLPDFQSPISDLRIFRAWKPRSGLFQDGKVRMSRHTDVFDLEGSEFVRSPHWSDTSSHQKSQSFFSSTWRPPGGDLCSLAGVVHRVERRAGGRFEVDVRGLTWINRIAWVHVQKYLRSLIRWKSYFFGFTVAICVVCWGGCNYFDSKPLRGRCFPMKEGITPCSGKEGPEH